MRRRTSSEFPFHARTRSRTRAMKRSVSIVKSVLLYIAEGKIDHHDYTHVETATIGVLDSKAFRKFLERNPYMMCEAM